MSVTTNVTSIWGADTPPILLLEPFIRGDGANTVVILGVVASSDCFRRYRDDDN